MLKFLRKYQKVMLVVFCAGLMVAFLIPQAAQQFVPDMGKASIGTTGDGEKITQELIRITYNDLQRMRRLGMDPFPGFALVPNSGDEQRDALTWILIQRAAEANGLKAGQQQGFSLVANLMGVQTEDQMEDEARKDGANAKYLIRLGQQYLLAEQFRQLISGIEYAKPVGDEQTTGSPGLRRLQASVAASQFLENLSNDQQFMMELQLAQFQGISPQQLVENRFQQAGFPNRILGNNRVTADEIRYALQRQLAEVDITVALIDAAKGAEEIEVDDAFVQSIFERYAGDDPGTGEPYRVGYRVPPRVKIEALRFPIDAAREVVAKEVNSDPAMIKEFYDANRADFFEPPPIPEEGEEPAPPKPQRLTADQRDEIRTILTQVNASEKIVELAQQARQMLNEQARGLDDDGPYKKLPADFTPTPLVQIASEIENESGISPELITVDAWTSPQDMIESSQFIEAWVNELPTANLRLPNPRFGGLSEVPVQQSVLGGKTGLFTAELEVQQQKIPLGFYITAAKPFVEDIENLNDTFALQPKLPGQIIVDVTGSTYVFRITEADPSHPAPELAPIVDQVTEDAKKIKAYENMLEGKDDLLTKAADIAITSVTEDKDAIKTFSGLSRSSASIQLEGVANANAILLNVFNTVDGLVRSGGVQAASQADRVFLVELAGDYKLAVVRIDDYRPMTRSVYESLAMSPAMLMNTSEFTTPPHVESPMSLEALIKYTGFQPADGESVEDFLSNENDEDAEADEEV